MTGQVFEFEHGYAHDLRGMPMAVREKLDRTGIRASRKQWQALPLPERQALLEMPCATHAESQLWRGKLVELLKAFSDVPVEETTPVDPTLWVMPHHCPSEIAAQCALKKVPVPSQAQWGTLTPLQRFSLLKLSRSERQNRDFLPAMKEFGLA
ncbi:hypothetical protein E3E12_03640 [Formicincola oecophyllae]|uniref:Nitrate reductase associated protein n=1 Tax=Formicincola oecophyllae TaxID=2558361 RepID=A0A4Y6UAM3_9PROT|nr:nitrate reductase associated protein [Formicincola oecophyllae]QDH13441.1 hypothetical protein E3E12_03640 [Formicincola oecophyllae]